MKLLENVERLLVAKQIFCPEYCNATKENFTLFPTEKLFTNCSQSRPMCIQIFADAHHLFRATEVASISLLPSCCAFAIASEASSAPFSPSSGGKANVSAAVPGSCSVTSSVSDLNGKRLNEIIGERRAVAGGEADFLPRMLQCRKGKLYVAAD
jgi:hypothetical protein